MNLSMPEKKQPAPRRGWLLLALLVLMGGAAAVWQYHSAGRLQLQGVLRGSLISLPAPRDGVLVDVPARPGPVGRGQVLARYDAAAQRASLAEEERRLNQLALLVPPKFMRLPAPDGGEETLLERLERQRAAEHEAERRLQAASDAEAKASILYSRAGMLADRHRLRRDEAEAARAHVEAARREVLDAKDDFEAVSLERVQTEKTIRQVTDMQNQAGASSVPEETRVRNYEQQKLRVAQLQASLVGEAIVAPMDGSVLEVAVRPGARVLAGQPCVLFQPMGQPPRVRALVPPSLAGRLEPGQQCRVRFAGTDESVLAARVSAVAEPGPDDVSPMESGGAPFAVVWIDFPPPEAEKIALLEEGGRAEITVLLREPLLALLPTDQNGLPSGGGANPHTPMGPISGDLPFPAAPSGEPISVEGAYGGAGYPPSLGRSLRPGSELGGASSVHPDLDESGPRHVPSLRSGSPEALGLPPSQQPLPEALPGLPASIRDPAYSLPPAPNLPPMRTPDRLTGSPLPHPGNNPSVVPPKLLQEPEVTTRP